MSSIFRAIKTLKEEHRWQRHFDAMAPKAGDIAPDFELRNSNGQDSVRLFDFKEKKPVALIFGSFT